MTTSLILQGPFSTRFFDQYEYYCQIFDDIIISTYGDDSVAISTHWPRLVNSKTKIILNSSRVPIGINNHGNAWYQSMSTLAGLRAATGTFAVKARMDESWGNMKPLLDSIQQYPLMMHCINLYFRKDSELKYHVSDHLYGGARKRMIDACEIVLRWCENRQYMIETWQEMAWSECMTGAAWVTASGHSVDPTDSCQQMIKTVKIVPIQTLEPFCFSSISEQLTYTSIEEIAACRRVGPGLINWLYNTTAEYMI